MQGVWGGAGLKGEGGLDPGHLQVAVRGGAACRAHLSKIVNSLDH